MNMAHKTICEAEYDFLVGIGMERGSLRFRSINEERFTLLISETATNRLLVAHMVDNDTYDDTYELIIEEF